MSEHVNSFPPTDRINMGTAIPATDKELTRYLANAIAQFLEAAPSQEAARNAAKVSGAFAQSPNLANVTVDLSGYRVKEALFPDAGERTIHANNPALDRAHTEPATLAALEFRAHPLEVIGVPVSLEAHAQQVPIAWVTDQAGTVWLTAPDDLASDTAVDFSGQVNLDAVRAEARKFLIKQTANADVQLRDIDIDITQTGQQFTIAARAKARYKIVTANVTASAVVIYDKDALTFTAQNIKIRSSNPLLGVALAVFSRRITSFEGNPININDSFKNVSQRVTALDINLDGQDLRVTGRVA